MRAAVVVDGVVVNIITAPEGFAMDGAQIIPSETAEKGQLWDGQAFSDPPPKPAPVPETISDRQFWQALAILNLISKEEALAAVTTGAVPSAMEAFFQGMSEDAEFEARMLLQGAKEFRRSHPLTGAFGAMQGMTSDQIDDLWRLASSL